MTRFIIFVLIFGLFGTSIVHAKGEIHPWLRLRQEYNDNIFLAPADEEQGDYITTIEPGLSALWQGRLLRLDLDYSLRYRKYAEFTGLDETRWRDTQRALMRAEFLHGRDFSLISTYEVSRVTTDPRGPIADEDSSVNRTNRNRLTVNPGYRLVRRTWTATLGYLYERLWYDLGAGDESEAHRGSLDLTRSLSRKVDLLLGVAREERAFDRLADYRRTDVAAGLTWKPASRFTLTAQGGWAAIDFEQQDVGATRAEEDRRSVTWRVQGAWDVRQSLRIATSYGETVELSINDGLFASRSADVTVSHERRMTTTLRLYGREDDYLIGDRRDSTAGMDLGLTVPLRRTVTLNIYGDAQRVSFRPGTEDAWRWRGTVSLDKTVRRFNLGAGYNFNAQDSDVEANDYLNNIVYVQAGVKF